MKQGAAEPTAGLGHASDEAPEHPRIAGRNISSHPPEVGRELVVRPAPRPQYVEHSPQLSLGLVEAPEAYQALAEDRMR